MLEYTQPVSTPKIHNSTAERAAYRTGSAHLSRRFPFTDHPFKNRHPLSDEISLTPGVYTQIGPSNTGSQAPTKLINISTYWRCWPDEEVYGSATLADNLSLFKTGNKIKIDEWQRYLFERGTFNDGSEIGFSIEIGLMTPTSVEIKIRTA